MVTAIGGFFDVFDDNDDWIGTANNYVWHSAKRWSKPTRATLKMRFFGYPHETQVEGLSAHGQIGGVVTGWNFPPWGR